VIILTESQRLAVIDWITKQGDRCLADLAYIYGSAAGEFVAPRPVLEAALKKCEDAVALYRSNGGPEEKYADACASYERAGERIRGMLS
jgi:hypothetical protein